jgi:hypothetical protein
MPRKRSQGPAPHTYSVWVSVRKGDETDMQMAYFGSSEYTARMKLASAVMDNPHAYSVDIRRDYRPWLRVLIERPPDVM